MPLERDECWSQSEDRGRYEHLTGHFQRTCNDTQSASWQDGAYGQPEGPATRAWKKEMFGPLSTKHFPAIGEHGLYHVHLVTSYTHLGGVIHYTGEVRAEVRRRVAIAHQAFSKHRKLVYQCRAFSLHKRAEIFRSLILSRLLYGADSWALWDSHSKMKLHSAIMKALSPLVG